ncbi:ABC transporter ATP-binding protein [Pleionea sp. CnH1-48]|uniref:ABC transporter ATP-binding protein n=1 Tax=Pleionea sp. CnH1-48 TaxID=2954494 RepID=UPI002097D3E8|nr:ABC transporter ATP-binding protein [Pleionea sp. CnH1-48]MCO7224333.1 ABC transporter ATP-binding protein [Pleionea sp. CnH1-48]
MLRFENIVKAFTQGETKTYALKGVSGSIQRGETVALCGPSGSGKSTLLNICGLLDNDYEGELFFDDEKVTGGINAATKMRRERIGFIFQRYNLIEAMTAFDNVEYPLLLTNENKSDRKEKVLSILKQVGLAGHEYKRPDQLSGGQQQRVAVARALVKKPDLVIADEPTANLDTETATVIIDLMRELGASIQTTFLVATHDSRMTERCHRTLNLQDGMLFDEVVGSVEEPQTKTLAKGAKHAEHQVSMV